MNSTLPVRPFAILKLATLGLLAVVLLLLNGCNWVGVKGNGKRTTETRAIEDYRTIEADGAFTVNWRPGAPALSITTDKNLMQYLRTRSSGGKLRIEWTKQLRPTRGIKIDLASSSLTGAELNGAVRLDVANMSGENFFLEGNGATRVALRGNVNALSASLNGASRLDADGLRTRSAELAINGAGRAEVNASDVLKVAVSGAGKVTYAGDPKIQQEINGAGSVRRRRD